MPVVQVDEVRDLVLDALNLREMFEPEDVEPHTPLFGDEGLGLDSLDALQLAVSLEEGFGVSVSEEQGRTVFQSVQAIADHINGSRA